MGYPSLLYISPHSGYSIFSELIESPEERGARTNYLNSQFGPVVRACRNILDFAKREHTVDDFAKHDVLSVQEVALRSRDEELLLQDQ